MDKASEALLALKPVTFHYKTEIDQAQALSIWLDCRGSRKGQSGRWCCRDKEGKPYTVRYDAVNAMLLNEFLKEHRTVQEQKPRSADSKHGGKTRSDHRAASKNKLKRLQRASRK